jgi:GWxTD domain-containing protein
MALRGGQVDRELNIDSTVTVNTNERIRLNKTGLYFIQQDSTTLEGISVLVTDPYFPQFVKAETLIEPLVYISTGRESKRIKDAENKKKAMDTYWLDLTKSPERAKNIIREYFQQVTEANYLFTTYKEGWKTDQGMILQLFGKPDGVYLNGESEEWVYQRKGAMSRIKFNFVKVKNFFTDHHYELVRNPSYDREWYRTVDLWRKGRQEI